MASCVMTHGPTSVHIQLFASHFCFSLHKETCFFLVLHTSPYCIQAQPCSPSLGGFGSRAAHVVAAVVAAVNMPMALYFSTIHQRGTVRVMDHLRGEYLAQVCPAGIYVSLPEDCRSTGVLYRRHHLTGFGGWGWGAGDQAMSITKDQCSIVSVFLYLPIRGVPFRVCECISGCLAIRRPSIAIFTTRSPCASLHVIQGKVVSTWIRNDSSSREALRTCAKRAVLANLVTNLILIDEATVNDFYSLAATIVNWCHA